MKRTHDGSMPEAVLVKMNLEDWRIISDHMRRNSTSAPESMRQLLRIGAKVKP